MKENNAETRIVNEGLNTMVSENTIPENGNHHINEDQDTLDYLLTDKKVVDAPAKKSSNVGKKVAAAVGVGVVGAASAGAGAYAFNHEIGGDAEEAQPVADPERSFFSAETDASQDEDIQDIILGENPEVSESEDTVFTETGVPAEQDVPTEVDVEEDVEVDEDLPVVADEDEDLDEASDLDTESETVANNSQDVFDALAEEVKVAEVAEQPVEEAVVTPAEEPVEEAVVTPAEEPVEVAVVTPAEEPVEEAVVTPAEEPVEEAVVTPAEEPVEEAVVTPAEEPVEEAVVTPAEEPVEEAVVTPAEEPAEEAVVTPAEEAVVAPAEEAVVTPAEEPVVVPAEEPVEEAVVTPAEEPVVVPAEEAVVIPAEEPVVVPVEEFALEGEESDLDVEVVEEPAYESVDISLAHVDTTDMSFNEAFAAARAEVGANGVFEWRGGYYGTYYSEEWSEMSDEFKQEFSNHNWAEEFNNGNDVVTFGAEEIESGIEIDGVNISLAHVDTTDMSFNEAFAAARAEVGADGVFEWRGGYYGTYQGDEWAEKSDEFKQAFGNHNWGVEFEAEMAEVDDLGCLEVECVADSVDSLEESFLLGGDVVVADVLDEVTGDLPGDIIAGEFDVEVDIADVSYDVMAEDDSLCAMDDSMAFDAADDFSTDDAMAGIDMDSDIMC